MHVHMFPVGSLEFGQHAELCFVIFVVAGDIHDRLPAKSSCSPFQSMRMLTDIPGQYDYIGLQSALRRLPRHTTLVMQIGIQCESHLWFSGASAKLFLAACRSASKRLNSATGMAFCGLCCSQRVIHTPPATTRCPGVPHSSHNRFDM